ncbi:MAG: hypothetical protein WD251_09880, partial [Saccharospirillum sp.]|uniref:hypothetical protein n=1 Tax=Saccharospirillum sp. TaxID=2033801 RepID=UPI0034A06831
FLILKTLSADMVRLLLVETRLFGHTGLAMIGLYSVFALLLASGWLFAGAAAVFALMSLQAFHLVGAMLTVALANFVLAALAYWRLRTIARDLTFRESRASVNDMLIQARSLVDPAAQGLEE